MTWRFSPETGNTVISASRPHCLSSNTSWHSSHTSAFTLFFDRPLSLGATHTTVRAVPTIGTYEARIRRHTSSNTQSSQKMHQGELRLWKLVHSSSCLSTSIVTGSGSHMKSSSSDSPSQWMTGSPGVVCSPIFGHP